jgi:hypothetical protein
MIDFKSSVVAGTVLVRSAIQSPNYVAGVSGWTINQDGSVEFNNAVIRGSIEAGGGVVRLNAGGVKVDGTTLQFDINFAGGFLARRILDDGAYGQLTMASSTPGSLLGGGVFMNPPDPSANGNTFSFAGAIYALNAAVGTVDAGETYIRSPILTGKTEANIKLFGENSDSTVAPRMELNGDTAVNGNLDVSGVGHEEYLKFTTVTVTNSTTLVNVPNSTMTIEAGCTYRVETYAAYNGPLAADARWAWAKTNATVVGDRNIQAPADSATDNTDMTMMSLRRGDATQQITGTTNGVANAFTLYREMCIWVNSGATDEAIQLQFAQGVANATGCVLQGGYIFLRKIVGP